MTNVIWGGLIAALFLIIGAYVKIKSNKKTDVVRRSSELTDAEREFLRNRYK